MKTSRSKDRYTLAEFFCGCGGFSRGFTMTGKFDVVFGNDIKGAALTTFRENHGGELGKPEIIKKDIRQIKLSKIVAALKEKGVEKGELDCLIGGPPCQGFSRMRRSEEREDGEIVRFGGYDKLSEDPRNDLVLRFLEVAQQLRPRFIVIENVPQMLTHGFNGVPGGLGSAIRQILEDDMEYAVDIDVLDAANYGVPQTRERVIILASRDGSASLPGHTHKNPDSTGSLKPWVTVEEAIGDLPPPCMINDELGGNSIDLYRHDPSGYACELRSKHHFPYNHVRRIYSKNVIEIIKEMHPGETWEGASERMRKSYAILLEKYGKSGEDREMALARLTEQGLINPVFYKNYYWSAYTRLAWKAPALTITANANYLGSGRYTHPEENRGITVREAARLQSFDDDFRFITSEHDTSDTENIKVGLDMVGKAVPPLLGRAIAQHILFLMEEDDTTKETDAIVRMPELI